MARVSADTIEKLNTFLDTIPAELQSKCAICGETLTHWVKTAEVQTGAGTATVTNAIADRINKDAAPGDQVSGHALNERVRQREGLNDFKIRKPENKPEPAIQAENIECSNCTNKPEPETIPTPIQPKPPHSNDDHIKQQQHHIWTRQSKV